jgi:hypothetical protein
VIMGYKYLIDRVLDTRIVSTPDECAVTGLSAPQVYDDGEG